MPTWVQISSGRGPVECGRAVALAAEALTRDLEGVDCAVTRVHAEPDEERGCFKSLLLSVEGDVGGVLRRWVGTIQWTCPSPYRPNHKRKNWFISVEAFTPPERSALDPRALRVDTFRASGAGGQHVNKTNSAVRVTHLPSGIQVVAMEERSQHLNRKLAMARLERLVEAQNAARDAEAREDRWAAHDQLERGNPTRRFKGPGFQPA